ncbi:Deoxyuridine 5'-triphosphate nucleotidohydrolase [uncultured archaeon]|nr:Deoxyuridine 5'-triphosphate nucleotidohydrolase [uncultured archaeon]
MRIKIKKLVPEAVIPRYAKTGDAGMDVFAVSKEENCNFIEYGTGLAFEIPEGYVCLIFPRSSVSNKSLSLCNCVGILDSGYRGELKLRFYQHKREDYQIGERIGQIIIIPFPEIEFTEADNLTETKRGAGGFGSTGNF